MQKHFLVGSIPVNSTKPKNEEGYCIIYTPAGSEYSKELLIGVYEPTLRGTGGSAPAATWVARNAEAWRPGWFAKLCQRAGCDWFMPIVERIASGEDVPLEKIQDTYRAHHAGRSMPYGTMRELYVIALANRGGP